ncbi:unnamed protein product [Cutaneotrichosporon oleaginosum]
MLYVPGVMRTPPPAAFLRTDAGTTSLEGPWVFHSPSPPQMPDFSPPQDYVYGSHLLALNRQGLQRGGQYRQQHVQCPHHEHDQQHEQGQNGQNGQHFQRTHSDNGYYELAHANEAEQVSNKKSHKFKRLRIMFDPRRILSMWK